MDDDPRIFPALYARWSYLRVAGKVRRGRCVGERLSDDCRAEGHQDRSHGRSSTVRHVPTRLTASRQGRANILRRQPSSTMQPPTARRPSSTAPTCRSRPCRTCASSTGCWAGSATRFVHGRAALDLAGQLRHAHSLGYAFSYVCMLHTLERDVQTVETLARQALAGATKRELPLWISVARTFLGWAEVESGCLEQGHRHAGEAAWFPREGAADLLAAHLSVLADRGPPPCCQPAGRQVLPRAGPRFQPPRWQLLVRGRVPAPRRAPCRRGWAKQRRSGAERCFEQALALADQRGQRGFALRTARDLAALLAGKGEPARAHEVLQDEFAFFTDQPEGGDRTDAKALLCSLRGASPR